EAGPPYTGRCMCGGVRFEVTEEPAGAGYCHCTRCQRRTGTAASAQARLVPGSFRLLAGEELVREYAPGDGWPKCFCSVCGSALWSKYPDTGEVGSVRLGLFDPGHDIRPQWRTFVDYACEWEPIPEDGLERYAAGRLRGAAGDAGAERAATDDQRQVAALSRPQAFDERDPSGVEL